MGCLHVELCVRQGSKEVSYISSYWSEIRMSLVVGRGSLRNSNRADGGRRPGLYVEYGTALAIAPPGRGYACLDRTRARASPAFPGALEVWSEILCVSAVITSRKRFFIRSSFLQLSWASPSSPCRRSWAILQMLGKVCPSAKLSKQKIMY